MKNKNWTHLILVTGIILIMSSCSQQRFAYREKVSVDQQQAKVLPKQLIQLDSKSQTNIPIPASGLTSNQTVSVQPAPIPAIKSIQQMVPQMGSKASVTSGSEKPQKLHAAIKQLKKEVNPAAHDVNIDGMKWMIVGLIVIVVGIVLSIISGALGGAVASIGGLVFLIGLIFYLLKILA